MKVLNSRIKELKSENENMKKINKLNFLNLNTTL